MKQRQLGGNGATGLRRNRVNKTGSSPPSEMSKKTMGLPLSSSSSSSAMVVHSFGDGDGVAKELGRCRRIRGVSRSWRSWKNGTEHQLLGGPHPRRTAATASFRQSKRRHIPCVVM